MKLDALVIAAHPDDAEISVGGTLLRMAEAGRAIGILDLTRGDMGTRGDAQDRAREVEAANAQLRLAWRGNLELPDGRVEVSLDARERIAAVIRELRPEVVLAHHREDLHPDHAAAGELARAAWYLAGLARLAQISGGAPAHRPARIYHFLSHVPFEPTFVVDTSAQWERKLELVRCYASQLSPAHAADRGAHFLFGADILQRLETKGRAWGERIGVAYGEPLLHLGPLPASDPLL